MLGPDLWHPLAPSRSEVPCFVINLPSDVERWRAVEQQCKAAGLEPARIEAVLGRELSLADLHALYSPELNKRQYHKPLVAGEIGCYASHLKVMRRIVELEVPCAAVFEDDVMIDPSLPEVIAAVSKLPPDWHVIKLIGRPCERAAQTLALTRAHRLIRYRRVPSLTSAYLISLEGARTILRTRIPFGRPIDVDLRHWWENRLDIRGVLPYPVALAPSSGQSTISHREAKAVSARERWLKLRNQVLYTLNNAIRPLPARGSHVADHN